MSKDKARIRANNQLQGTALADSKWRTVSAPIARRIRTITSTIVDTEGFKPVKFNKDAMDMMVEIAQQFMTLSASDIQENVEHAQRHTAIDTDVNIARSTFATREGLLSSPAQRHLNDRYEHHSARSKEEIGRKSTTVRKRFATLS